MVSRGVFPGFFMPWVNWYFWVRTKIRVNLIKKVFFVIWNNLVFLPCYCFFHIKKQTK